jgi:hypothetical protein
MGWTKKDVINKAFAQIGLASYEFDISAEEYASALSTLDSMFGTWASLGFFKGYLMNASVVGDITAPMYIPAIYHEAAYTNLAVALCPEFSAAPNPFLVQRAVLAYNALMQAAAAPIEQNFTSTTPLGAGNTRNVYNQTFYQGSSDVVNGPSIVPNFLP